MDALISRIQDSRTGGARTDTYTVWFGGSYREIWSDNYSLAVVYDGRRPVQARWAEDTWLPVGGDEELCAVLRSPTCPLLLRQYFQAAASVYAAMRVCVSRGMSLEQMGEVYYDADNPFAAPELMRLLMDDCGFAMPAAFQMASRCCGDLRAYGVDVEAVYSIQPRTAHVISILRSCAVNTPAAEHIAIDPSYRQPLGALPEGQELTLRLRNLAGRAENAYLILYGDSLRRELPMERTEEGFSVSFCVPEKAQALWYCFRLETPDSSHWICPDSSGYRGKLCGKEQGGFRLTVYRKDFETPAWFRRRVMYQIFPDRFAFSNDGTAERGVAYHLALSQNPELHKSLAEPPRWQPRPFEENYTPDDFYGGTLRGIEEKLGYLRELGVGVIYLNPIVEARSNHRYDTSDYLNVDPILGTNRDLTQLCEKAEAMGMRVILDGVFSHTGDDSVYFNRYRHYPDSGACQGESSPYYDWYDFRHFPDQYRCWWGFDSLPEVEETRPSWQNFVITGENSVVKTWLRRGAAGWRLDVADELPDEVLSLIRKAAREEKPDALILGEVWEDAVIKESYGSRRNYALGWSLDTVMNYPLRRAILDFALGRINAYALRDFLISQQMNYPKPLYYSLMNLLGSHDVERLRSALATSIDIKSLSREDQLKLEFSPEALARATRMEKLCAAIQFSLPGVPSIYYGDEQGMCGVGDPFNRLPFRKGDRDLCNTYAALARRRNENPALSTGEAAFMAADQDVLVILRYIREEKDVFGLPAANGTFLTVVNRSEKEKEYSVNCSPVGGVRWGRIAPMSAEVIRL